MLPHPMTPTRIFSTEYLGFLFGFCGKVEATKDGVVAITVAIVSKPDKNFFSIHLLYGILF